MIAPWIIAHFPPHRVYTEAFAGAGSVLLRKPRSLGEVLNDLDGEIVNVFRVLRNEATAASLTQALWMTPFAREEWSETFENSGGLEPVEWARRTLVRAALSHGFSSFNSTCATGFRNYTGKNRSGLPVHDWANFPAAIAAFTERLRGVIIEQRPAIDILREHDADDALHYVDPPYVLSTRGCIRGVRQKYRHELSDDDHRALAEVLRSLRGAVVLSGYPCELYDNELFTDWHRVQRRGLSSGPNERTEVLWLNDAVATRRQSVEMELIYTGEEICA